jgi:hypothetical protein
MYETLEKLRRLPIHTLEEEFLVQEVCMMLFYLPENSVKFRGGLGSHKIVSNLGQGWDPIK